MAHFDLPSTPPQSSSLSDSTTRNLHVSDNRSLFSLNQKVTVVSSEAITSLSHSSTSLTNKAIQEKIPPRDTVAYEHLDRVKDKERHAVYTAFTEEATNARYESFIDTLQDISSLRPYTEISGEIQLEHGEYINKLLQKELQKKNPQFLQNESNKDRVRMYSQAFMNALVQGRSIPNPEEIGISGLSMNRLLLLKGHIQERFHKHHTYEFVQSQVSNCLFASLVRSMSMKDQSSIDAEMLSNLKKYSEAYVHSAVSKKTLPNPEDFNVPGVDHKKTQQITSQVLHNVQVGLKRADKDYQALCKDIKKLHEAITKEVPKDKLQAKNKEIMMLLRQCMNHSVYEMIKHDESIPAISYLHGIAMASFLHPKPMTYFQDIGNEFDSSSEKASLKEKVTKGCKNAVKKGMLRDDGTLEYFFRFTAQRIGAFFSTSIGSAFMDYDPRVALENAAGTLYSQPVEIGQKKVVSRTIYTPSPTVGNSVAPEMRMFVQAMHNRRIAAIEDKENTEKTPRDIAYPNVVHWHYTNLQNIRSGDEGPRSIAIMQMAEEYPLSFSAVTVSHDSKFYMDGIHSKSPEKLQKEIIQQQTPNKSYTPSVLNEEYKAAFRKELLDPHNYSLSNPKQGKGYYFPIDTKNVQAFEKWQRELGQILDEAYEKTSQLQMPEDFLAENQTLSNEERQKIFEWEKKAAFRELVTIGITRYFQTKAIANLPDGTITIDNESCKEDIDRGGKLTAELSYTAIDDHNTATQFAYNAVMSRAPLARYRVVLAHRIQPFMSLSSLVSHNTMKIFARETIPNIAHPEAKYHNSQL